ncbi:hypothetical protein VV869_16030 [Photobacterium sp. MCCC 1A19761]|uniref:hypothetical protein n=1 Tax=Photobacterium sp. MCCC 1A19761 TaxID=3115000 RepID=UPI00307E2DC2
MRQSVYLRLAVLLIRLDVQREEAQWRRQHSRVRVHMPNLSLHLKQDIGIAADNRVDYAFPADKAGRLARRLRRGYQSRWVT